MGFQPCPNVIEVAVHGEIDGDLDYTNVFHAFLADATPLSSGFANGLGAILASCYDDFKAYLHPHTILHGATVTDIRTLGGPQFEATVDFPVTGTGSGAPLPNECCALVKWTTALRGRWFRGRTYFGGFTEDASAGNSLEPGLITALSSGCADIIETAGFGVLSRFFNKNKRATGLYTPIIAATVENNWFSQRGRRVGA